METHYHYHFGPDDQTILALKKINKTLKKMAENQAQLAEELGVVKAQVEKITTEYTTRIATLEEALVAAGNITPEVQAALDGLKASVQIADDVTPDPAV